MACGCPDNGVYNSNTGLCDNVYTSPFSLGSALVTIPSICQGAQNMVNGTAFYAAISPSQFPLTGQNSASPSFLDAQSTAHTPTGYLTNGPLWINNLAGTAGLLNQRGVGLPSPANTWYGVNRCVTVGTGDVISFALSSRSAFRLYIDGVLAIIHQPSSPGRAYDYLHVFPITLPVGQYTFRAEGLSTAAYLCSEANVYGNLLVEVYKNVTATNLSGVTSQTSLNSFYATTNGSIPQLLAGLNFDVSSNVNSALFYCEQGYVNACTPGGFNCTYKTTHPYVICCWDLIDCNTSARLITNVNLTNYEGKYVKIEGYSGCYLVNASQSNDCVVSINVVIVSVYDDCPTCSRKFYKLTDCNGNYTDIYTGTDLSASVGKIIKIEGFDAVCWIVSLSEASTLEQDVTTTLSYNSCQECNYIPPIPPNYALAPVALKYRSVQPGYGSSLCDNELVESVSCGFADQVYAKFVNNVYGVDTCKQDCYDNFFIKKQILNINLIDDPQFCKVTTCCAPCIIGVEIVNFNLSVVIQNTVPPVIPCLVPTAVTAQFSYQSL